MLTALVTFCYCGLPATETSEVGRLRAPLFNEGQTPTEVRAAIADAGPLLVDELHPSDRAPLGTGKLRLVGIYDDRFDGTFMLRTPCSRRPPERRAARGAREHRARFRLQGPRRRGGRPLRRDHHPPGHPDPLDPLREPRGTLEPLRRRRPLLARGLRKLGAQHHLLPGRRPRPARSHRGRPDHRRRQRLRDGQRAPQRLLAAQVQDRDHRAARATPRRAGELHRLHPGTPGRQDRLPRPRRRRPLGLPRLATELDLFVEAHQVVPIVRATLELYCAEGDFEHSSVNRFRALVHQLGPIG